MNHVPPPSLPPSHRRTRPAPRRALLHVLAVLAGTLLLATVGTAHAAAKTVADQHAAFAPRLNADGELELGVLRADYRDQDQAWSPAADTVIATRTGSRTSVPPWVDDLPEFADAWGAPGDPLWTTGGEASRGDAECTIYRDAEERQTVDLADSIALLRSKLATVGRTINTTTILHGVTRPTAGRVSLVRVSAGCTPDETPWATLLTDSGRPDTLPTRWRTEGDNETSAPENPITLASTAAGYACLDLEVRATLQSGRPVRAREGFAVAIGDVDPQAAPACPVGEDDGATNTTVSASTGGGVSSTPEGTEVTFTASVWGATTPEGTVRFFDDDGRGGGEQPLGDAVEVDEDGVARVTTDELGPGAHTIRAAFTPQDEEQQAPSTGTIEHFRVHAPGHYVYTNFAGTESTHGDVAVRSTDDGGLDLGTRIDAFPTVWEDLDDTILVVSDRGKETVPAPTALQDFGLLGPVGSDVWQIPLARKAGIPWFGVSSESLVDADYQRYTAWRLEGVSGLDGGQAPGEFVLWDAANGAKPFFSTREGTPDAVRMLARASGHWHATWSFTAPGVYCLNMSVRNRTADSGRPVEDHGVLTVVVGDEVDPYGTKTCAEQGARPTGTPAAQPVRATAGQTHVLDSEDTTTNRAFAALTPQLQDGALDVPLVEGSDRGPGVAYDLDDAIIRLPKDANATIGTADAGAGSRVPWAGEDGQRVWEIDEAGEEGRYRLGWDTTRLADDDLQGDLRWRLTGVEGPGEFVLHDEWSHRAGHALLSTRPGHTADRYDLWAGRRDNGTWIFSRAGVYCVGMEWSGTRGDGTAVSTTKTVTFVVGDVDPATVTPCGHGGGDSPQDGGAGAGGGSGAGAGVTPPPTGGATPTARPRLGVRLL
ncbi:choice-of-anchor M domain-containing protein, partial [Patulibacter sp. S7RM1-6]